MKHEIYEKEVSGVGAFLQGDELLILLVILLLILGPTKLPQLAKGLGQAMREFKKASQGLYDEETIGQAKKLHAASESGESSSDIDMDLVKKLASKLEVSTEGKSNAELVKEVLAKAKEKGII